MTRYDRMDKYARAQRYEHDDDGRERRAGTRRRARCGCALRCALTIRRHACGYSSSAFGGFVGPRCPERGPRAVSAGAT